MKRLVRLVLVCAALGVVVNVGVAWMLSMSMRFPPPTLAQRENADGPWPVRVPAHWPARRVHIYWRLPGLRYDRWDAGVFTAPPRVTFTVDEACFGWPWPSLTAAIVRETEFPGAGWKYLMTESDYTMWIRGLPAPVALTGAAYRASQTLPVRPRWPQFVGSSLVLALPFVMVGFAWPRLRRAVRVRRGCCTSCGYSLLGLAAGSSCPECGSEGAATPSPVSP